MKVLFIGDISGEPGRRAVKICVPALRATHGLTYVVANGENSAGGAGITTATAREILDSGVDVITTGDHVWDHKEVYGLLGAEPRVLRPANYPPNTIGRGTYVATLPGQTPLAVLNLQGRTFMAALNNPFEVARAEVDRLRAVTPAILVDFHAEATSEKIALSWYLDGQVSAIIGTHTHVQTADERILPNGTACLTDAGFTGGHDGVLGREHEPVVQRFLTLLPQKFGVCDRNVQLNGCLVEIDDVSGRARSIQRISEKLRG
ncbi:MAG TPA: TIGR00282 family metallophosphoesterase [Verrucomicrobiota bacterium]|nr:TIGR00282 family metallophosphoesterase [Verrucomicrobiales bacterium]HRI13922.1 TIGR00282 family metallophosphoesterase [Verrucomicrobiota bacterium]